MPLLLVIEASIPGITISCLEIYLISFIDGHLLSYLVESSAKRRISKNLRIFFIEKLIDDFFDAYDFRILAT